LRNNEETIDVYTQEYPIITLPMFWLGKNVMPGSMLVVNLYIYINIHVYTVKLYVSTL